MEIELSRKKKEAFEYAKVACMDFETKEGVKNANNMRDYTAEKISQFYFTPDKLEHFIDYCFNLSNYY